MKVEALRRIDRYSRIRDFILEHLFQAQEKNNSFSLRALSGRMKINPGNLSAFLRGKRGLSEKEYELVINYFDFDKKQADFYRPFKLEEISEDAFKIVTLEREMKDIWKIMVALPLMERFSELEPLAEFMKPYGINIEDLEEILSFLSRKGIVDWKSPEFKFIFSKNYIKFDFSQCDVQEIYRSGAFMLEVLSKQINGDPQDRYFSYSAISLSKQDYEDLLLKLRVARQDLLADSCSKAPVEEQVPYILQTSLFPFRP